MASKLNKLTNEERLHYFLEELTSLTERYGLEIGGCGCCGSPYLTDCSTETEKINVDSLQYTTKGYTVNDSGW